MFNSQKINNDPKPWRLRHCAHQPSGRGCSIDSCFEACECGYDRENWADFSPRSEYDNSPNPILEYFRNALASSECEVTALATIWESLIDTGYDWENGGLTPTPEHITHARKVLGRLANFYSN